MLAPRPGGPSGPARNVALPLPAVAPAPPPVHVMTPVERASIMAKRSPEDALSHAVSGAVPPELIECVLSKRRIVEMAALLDKDAVLDPAVVQILDDFMGAIVSDATTCAADLARSRQLSAHTIPHIRGRNIDAVLGMGGAAKAPPTGFDMVQGNSRLEFQDASVAAPPVLSTSDVQLYVQEVMPNVVLAADGGVGRSVELYTPAAPPPHSSAAAAGVAAAGGVGTTGAATGASSSARRLGQAAPYRGGLSAVAAGASAQQNRSDFAALQRQLQQQAQAQGVRPLQPQQQPRTHATVVLAPNTSGSSLATARLATQHVGQARGANFAGGQVQAPRGPSRPPQAPPYTQAGGARAASVGAAPTPAAAVPGPQASVFGSTPPSALG